MPLFLGLAGLLLPARGEAGTVKEVLEQRLTEAFQEPVSLQAYRLALEPPVATLEGLQIGKAGPRSGDKPLVVVPRVRVELDAQGLLAGTFRFRSLCFEKASITVEARAGGSSSLRLFLSRLLQRPAGQPAQVPVVDAVEFQDVTFHFLPPESSGAASSPREVTAKLRSFRAGKLAPSAPAAPGAPQDPGQDWGELAFEGLVIEAPGAETIPEAPASCVGLEGLEAASGRLQFRVDPAERLVLLRAMQLGRLRGRSWAGSPSQGETLARIWKAVSVGILGAEQQRAQAPAATVVTTPAAAEAGPLEPPPGYSCLLEDLQVGAATFEFAAADPAGHYAYWRLEDLTLEGRKIGYGPAPRLLKEAPGRLWLASTTRSSEGPGDLNIRFEEIQGSLPQATFRARIYLKGLALPAFSIRMGNPRDSGFVRGTLKAFFAGPVRAGQMELEGQVVVSPGTRLLDAKGALSRSRNLERVATGEPVEPVRLRGPLSQPRLLVPTRFRLAMKDLGRSLSSSGPAKFLSETVEPAVQDGVRTIGEGVERIPQLGEVFEGD